MESRRDVYQAITGPPRREIIGLLAQKYMNLNAISANFDVSRQLFPFILEWKYSAC